MHPDVSGAGTGDPAGPFAHYPASPLDVSTRAEELLTAAERVDAVGDRAYARGRRALAATEGEIVATLDQGLTRLKDQVHDVKASAVVAAGALTVWARAITDYNAGVDLLNAEHESARDASGPSRPMMLAGLRVRHTALAAELDDAAERVAGILRRGPSQRAILRLFQHGTLPLRVASLMSEYDFSGVDIGELVRRLQRHGEVPYDLEPKQIARAVRMLADLADPDNLPWSWHRSTLTATWERLSQLDPRAIDYVVLGLSDDQLALIDRMVSTSVRERQTLPPGLDSGLDRFDLADFHTLFLAHASSDTLGRLERCWRSIRPAINTADNVQDGSLDRPRWRRPDDTELFDGEPSADDIDQGALGDCWMQAKLAAIAQDDPDWVHEHIRRNPNGTVTVTFYDDDGDPHEVTVTDQLPLDDDGEPVFSGDSGTGAPWADYYETAFAVISDHHSDDESGYGGIEQGRAGDDAGLMTGHDADSIEDEGGFLGFGDTHKDFDDVRQRVEDGDPVVVATTDSGPSYPFAPNHAFYVKGFNDDGDIVLGNPWSRHASSLVLDEGEFNNLINDAAAIKP